MSSHFKQTQAIFLQFLIVWSPLQLTQMPQTPDQAVFVLTTTTTTTTDGQTDYFTPCCACARGVTTTTTTTDGQNDYLTPCCACARGVIRRMHIICFYASVIFAQFNSMVVMVFLLPHRWHKYRRAHGVYQLQYKNIENTDIESRNPAACVRKYLFTEAYLVHAKI